MKKYMKKGKGRERREVGWKNYTNKEDEHERMKRKRRKKEKIA